MAQERKWTPGPWSVYDVGEFPGVDSDSGESIILWGYNGDESGVRGMANAHLIAAAPELYDALEVMLRYGRSVNPEAKFPQAVKALAKARGDLPC